MSQQQHMNMPGMGGPVGGPAMAAQMNNPNNQAVDMSAQVILKKLNTAIYDYLLRNQLYDIARSFCDKMLIETKPETKDSPDQRNGQMNGVDDGMDDTKDVGIAKRPDGLPLPNNLFDGPFLQDWWCQFWEIWHGHRGKGKNGTQMYIGVQRQAQKGRFNMMGGDPNIRYNNMMQMNNGMPMNPNDLKRTAMQQSQQVRNNMTPQQMAQLKMQTAAQQNSQMMQGNQMERQGSQMDLGGPRSGSPSGDAPSPKRQRIEGGMQPMTQGRPGQPGQMHGNQVGHLSELPQSDTRLHQTLAVLRENEIDAENIPKLALQNLSTQSTDVQKKTVEVYSHSMQQQMQAALHNLSSAKSNVNKGINPNAGPGGAQGSPMSQAGMDGTTAEFYAANSRMQMPQNGAAAGQAGNGNGNHALQDYQMQLMLLEQQNKKRLLMARQEQDNMGHPAGIGPNGQFAPGMSPQGSQRGGDPSDAQRGSPTPGMMDPNQVPPNMRAQMMMGPNGQVMRPPSSHPMPGMTPQQMEIMRQQGVSMNGQMIPGQPPQGQMMPGQQGGPGGQQGQQPMGTPRQQNNMPPPPAPQATATGAQPSSPPQQAAPPTPNQTAKPKPVTKKEAAKKGGNKKGGAAAATPATESEQPPTPTPATPATPMNANSFAHKQNQQLPNGQPAPNTQAGSQGANASNTQQPNQNAQQQQQNAVANAQPAQAATLDMTTPFGSLDNNEFGMDLGFSIGDELENFDFESFLNTDGGDPLAFDANFAFDGIESSLEGTN